MRSTLEFPPDGPDPLDPEWWAPLEGVARVAVTDARYRFFDLGDFMLMARLDRRPRPRLVLYKHLHTRRYLNLDDGGHAYRYVAPRPGAVGNGRYLRHRDLTAALDHLGLWELPWMKPGLEDHRCGLSWEDRWVLRETFGPGGDAYDPAVAPGRRSTGRGG